MSLTQPKLTLLYFDIHGLAARIRLAAAVGGVELNDKRFASREEFTSLKESGEFPYGQVPCLYVNSGSAQDVKIAQSGAILRYICRLGGLHPEDAVQAAIVDAALAAEGDAFSAHGAVIYRGRSGLAHLDATALAIAEKDLRENVIPRHLGYLEKLLSGSSTGWVANTQRPSPADFAWGTQLHQLRTGGINFVPSETLAPFPKINAFLDKFLAVPQVKSYYKL